MMLKQRWVTIVFLLSSCVAATLQAQSLLPTDWPSQFRDGPNTSSTPVVPPADLKIMWEIPTRTRRAPLLYFPSSGSQLLITGNKVCEAWSGLTLKQFDHEVELAAITTAESKDVLMTAIWDDENGDTCHAYDLQTFDRLWSLVILEEFGVKYSVQVMAGSGVFYLVGEEGGDDEFVAAINAVDGNVIWRAEGLNSGGLSSSGYPSALATVSVEGTDTTCVFVAGYDALRVLDAATGELQWSGPGVVLSPPCIDEVSGILFTDGFQAIDTADGAQLWSQPVDGLVNSAPTLGWAVHQDGGPPQAAAFAVTGLRRVYAFHRENGQLLWETTIPEASFGSAVFCGDEHGGQLYIASNNQMPGTTFGGHGHTFVLDAFTGNLLQVLRTNAHVNRNAEFITSFGKPYKCSPIVDAGNGSDFEPVMYVLTPSDDPTSHNMLVAWSASGDLYPPIYQPSIVADPAQVLVNSSAQISVTLTDGWNSQPLEAEEIQFSCDAGRFEGEVLPVSAITDANGVATTTYHSGKRECVVTITATTFDGTQIQTTVTVSKSVPDDPPPTTDEGTIQGTVSAGGKPARKVPVQLLQDEQTISQTTTNPQGKYTFDAVPIGDYVVQSTDGDLSGSESVTVEAGATVTQDIVLQ